MPRTSAADRKRQEAEVPKLTRAQSDLLRDVVSGVSLSLTKGDEGMLKALARQGLVERHVPRWGHLNARHEWIPTEAGRAHPAVASRG